MGGYAYTTDGHRAARVPCNHPDGLYLAEPFFTGTGLFIVQNVEYPKHLADLFATARKDARHRLVINWPGWVANVKGKDTMACSITESGHLVIDNGMPYDAALVTLDLRYVAPTVGDYPMAHIIDDMCPVLFETAVYEMIVMPVRPSWGAK
jgi:hypothetical protein